MQNIVIGLIIELIINKFIFGLKNVFEPLLKIYVKSIKLLLTLFDFVSHMMRSLVDVINFLVAIFNG